MREFEEGTERKCYTVSEAVQQCGVPSHVLRYWEDELGLQIDRTVQGHRVYSEENLAVFAKVKELKEKGIQLKAIRLLLENSDEGLWLGKLLGEEMTEKENIETNRCEEKQIRRNGREEEGSKGNGQEAEKAGTNECDAESVAGSDGIDWEESDYEIIPAAEADNYRRFEEMLRSLIGEVVAEQNKRLERTISERIHEEVEDLYIQLQQEEARQEAAAVAEQNACHVWKEGILKRIRKIWKDG
ncbi:MAG: MerR family transcriptional regulator [Clostridiales bacterium]|nr:MerR family transcriptional regulator [Clostridiales bacterium]